MARGTPKATYRFMSVSNNPLWAAWALNPYLSLKSLFVSLNVSYTIMYCVIFARSMRCCAWLALCNENTW